MQGHKRPALSIVLGDERWGCVMLWSSVTSAILKPCGRPSDDGWQRRIRLSSST